MTDVLPEFQASPYFNNPWKLFRNNSGETIPPFSVMRITGAESLATGLRMIVAKPNDAFKTHYLINGPYAVLDGDDGRGTTLAQADNVAYNSSSGTPAVDEEWGAKEDQWTLQKNRPGFIIIGNTKTSSGVTHVVARQHVVTQLKGKAGSNISKGSAGNVVIWMGASGAEAATEYTISCSALAAAITSAKYASVWLESGVWYVGPWEC